MIISKKMLYTTYITIGYYNELDTPLTSILLRRFLTQRYLNGSTTNLMDILTPLFVILLVRDMRNHKVEELATID